jgi:glycosyltransferase involved in cell wall biosynthesis
LTREAKGKSIDFMGFVEPRKFYEAVDVVVAPSLWHEPLPRSVIDARSYGRIAIGSNRGGILEAMGGEGAHGNIFDPDDDNALYDLMLSIVSGREILPSPYEYKTALKRYIDLYSDL